MALIIWKEGRAHELGIWYNVLGWLNMFSLADIGISNSIVRLLSLKACRDSGERKRGIHLGAAYFCVNLLLIGIIAIALFCGGRVPCTPHWFLLVGEVSAYLLIFAVATLGSSIMQARGQWGRSQALAIPAYVLGSLSLGTCSVVGFPPIESVAFTQCLFATTWLATLLSFGGYSPGRLLRYFASAAKCLFAAGVSGIEGHFALGSLLALSVQRAPLFVGTFALSPDKLGEFGRLSQMLAVVVSVSSFATNGIANRIIGDLQRLGAVAMNQCRRLLGISGVAACAASVTLLAALELRARVTHDFSSLILTRYERTSLAIGVAADSLVVAIIPIVCYLEGAAFKRHIAYRLIVYFAPIAFALSVSQQCFIYGRAVSSVLLLTLLSRTTILGAVPHPKAGI